MRLSDVMRPHLPAVHGIVTGALEDYERLYVSEAKIAHDASCRAHNINRHMLMRAAKYAVTNPATVKTFESKKLQGIICNQLVAFLFKKLDDELRSRNNLTSHIRDYRNQREIAGIPAAVKLIGGYRENDETGELIGVYVTRPSGYGNRWVMLLTGDDATPVTTPLFEEEEEQQEVEILPRKEPGEVIPFVRGEKGDDDKS